MKQPEAAARLTGTVHPAFSRTNARLARSVPVEPRMFRKSFIWIAAAAFLLMIVAQPNSAGNDDPPMRSKYLYTTPDASAAGGIRGTIEYPNDRLVAAIAIPPHEPRLVYKGQITNNGRGFLFTGLPIAKYDLALVFEKSFYEGFTLTYEENSLTSADLESIADHIHKSVPFFDVKRIHRTQGSTGREGAARSVLQELRTRPIRRTAPGTRVRSLKMAFTEDVNIGWQLVRTREFLHQEAGRQHYQELLSHYFHPELGDLRVVGRIRDLGALDLRNAETSPDM